MWTDAFAQAAAPAQEQNPAISMLIMLLQFLPIFLILYFLLIRPQQQKQKKTEEMVKALKKGDKVVTNGGIYGVIVGIDEEKAVLKIAENTKVEFARSAIVQLVSGESS